ncbi:MAG: RluA family pseudouridine synthase [Treponema sp.]|nr:RluA family pseudouridine synthase [Treponema sp.]
MDFTDFIAGKDDNGRRLDRVLQKILPQSPSSGIYSAIRKKLIRVNRQACKGNQQVFQGDCIQIASFLIKSQENPQNNYSNDKIKPDSVKSLDESDIVFMNEHILIVNKKSGISVQPGGKGVSLWEEVVQFYQKRQNVQSLSFKPGPLHRLDRFTSGLVAFSLSLEGARWFTEAMQAHQINKDYLGVAQGHLKQRETWTDFLEDSDSGKSGFYTVKVSQAGEKAVTEAIPLSVSQTKPLTLLQFKIHTGRKHQIRCQSAYHGYPLYCDSAYNPDARDRNHQKFFLHAYRLTFPKDNPLLLPETVEAPLPDDFEKFLSLNLINWDSQIIL